MKLAVAATACLLLRKSVFNRLALLYLGVFVQPNLYRLYSSGEE